MNLCTWRVLDNFVRQYSTSPGPTSLLPSFAEESVSARSAGALLSTERSPFPRSDRSAAQLSGGHTKALPAKPTTLSQVPAGAEVDAKTERPRSMGVVSTPS